MKSQVTCLSIDCPERKSLCCGALSIWNRSKFVCGSCGKKFVRGDCSAGKFADPTVLMLTELLAKMESAEDARECRHIIKEKILSL